jgi:hypothetical protein
MRNTENNFNSKSYMRDNEMMKAYGQESVSNALLDLSTPSKKNNFDKKDFRISRGSARRNIQSAKSQNRMVASNNHQNNNLAKQR